jgi:hypothetical protein
MVQCPTLAQKQGDCRRSPTSNRLRDVEASSLATGRWQQIRRASVRWIFPPTPPRNVVNVVQPDQVLANNNEGRTKATLVINDGESPSCIRTLAPLTALALTARAPINSQGRGSTATPIATPFAAQAAVPSLATYFKTVFGSFFFTVAPAELQFSQDTDSNLIQVGFIRARTVGVHTKRPT